MAERRDARKNASRVVREHNEKESWREEGGRGGREGVVQ